MKIFYSWQSDTASNVNRGFIKLALEDAVDNLQKDHNLDEADRIELDQDTKGVLGSPSIADTIFLKIKEADVVLVDVTITGETPAGKKQINSNVAIELGYSLGIHGDGVLLKVMNTSYGMPDDLPFDLRHRRWPVQYDLSPDAKAGEKKAARANLVKEFIKILSAYIDSMPGPDLPYFQPTESKTSSSKYWDIGEEIVPPDNNRQWSGLTYDAEPLMYLRLWPEYKLKLLTADVLISSNLTPLAGEGSGGWSSSRNKYGHISYSSNHDHDEVFAIAQLFRNGEVWGASSYLLRDRAESSDSNTNKYIPSIAFERAYKQGLRRYLDFVRNDLGYTGRINVEAGISSAEGYVIAVSNHKFVGPIYDESVVIRDMIEDESDEECTRVFVEYIRKNI